MTMMNGSMLSTARCFSSSTATQQQQLPRSIYVAKLRRAFLLRVHPDRFRACSPETRRRQSELVHAISDRMAQPDFLAYTCDEGIDNNVSKKNTSQSTSPLKYVLEHKDGSILEHSMSLNESVENVLLNMVAALESTSSLSMPPPPPTPTSSTTHDQQQQQQQEHEILWSSPRDSHGAGGVNHQYDVNSRAGRDLMSFLRTMDLDLIQERRASRMDVNAVTLVARRAFSFLSINGTGLGWSSASFCVLLRSLVELHEEHGSKFHVDSFYPLQLVWSSEEFDNPIDMFGGILYLNPASTPIQWLETFLTITQDTLDTYAANQAELNQNKSLVRGAFGGVKFTKGHSCSHEDYHQFLSRLAKSLSTKDGANEHETTTSTALTLESIVVTVEASCRRAVLTREGVIRVGATMDTEQISRAISKHSLEASERVQAEAERKLKCRETIDRAQWELGLLRVHAHTKLVQSEQINECLVRLLAMDQERDQLKRNLAGNSLGIAASGQFCHLGDDGSVVIPWDWR